MPLLKGRFTVPLKVLPDQDVSAADLHVIDYTGEKFLSKEYPLHKLITICWLI